MVHAYGYAYEAMTMRLWTGASGGEPRRRRGGDNLQQVRLIWRHAGPNRHNNYLFFTSTHNTILPIKTVFEMKP